MPGLNNSNPQPPMNMTEEAQNEKIARLKAALWYSTGQTVDAVAMNEDLNATPRFIGALSELVWAQIENSARDLEAFARHAGRDTIATQDVLLLARRNAGLEEMLIEEVKVISGRGT